MNEEQWKIYKRLIEIGQSAIIAFEDEEAQDEAENLKRKFIEEVHELENACEKSESLKNIIDLVVGELSMRYSYWEVDEWLFCDEDVLPLDEF